MARINLLPWREERRAQRRKEFLAMLGLSALAGVALAFLVISWHGAQIDGQEERNEYLRTQIQSLDTQIKEIERLDEQKARLLARKEVIEQLQASRSQMVHLFDALVRTIPDGVVLTSIRQEGQKLTLEGRSQSNARVSTYLRNLESSGWMTSPELSIIEARAGEPGLPFVFNLSVTLANPNAPRDEDGDGIPDAPAAPAAPVATGTTAAYTGDTAGPAGGASPAPAADGAPAPAGDATPPADDETSPVAEEGAQ
jgi:type IV pilus assembly protein PilN